MEARRRRVGWVMGCEGVIEMRGCISSEVIGGVRIRNEKLGDVY